LGPGAGLRALDERNLDRIPAYCNPACSVLETSSSAQSSSSTLAAHPRSERRAGIVCRGCRSFCGRGAAPFVERRLRRALQRPNCSWNMGNDGAANRAWQSQRAGRVSADGSRWRSARPGFPLPEHGRSQFRKQVSATYHMPPRLNPWPSSSKVCAASPRPFTRTVRRRRAAERNVTLPCHSQTPRTTHRAPVCSVATEFGMLSSTHRLRRKSLFQANRPVSATRVCDPGAAVRSRDFQRSLP
jgi:hypothetical protein